jgi:hypothetical protein
MGKIEMTMTSNTTQHASQVTSLISSVSVSKSNTSVVLPSPTQTTAIKNTSPEKTEAFLSIDVSKNFDVSLKIDGAVFAFLLFSAILIAIGRYGYVRFGRSRDFELDEAEFGFGQQKIKLRPNDDDRQIAYKIWVELSTRKIGLPIDLEQDVISEVYDSWHTFFTVTRELIKDVPVRKYQRDSTAKIIGLSIEVLNEGLRPHLTKWQARFRRWYERSASHTDFGTTDPQDIQRKFPAFDELAADLKLVNARLVAYRTRMHELIKSR